MTRRSTWTMLCVLLANLRVVAAEPLPPRRSFEKCVVIEAPPPPQPKDARAEKCIDKPDKRASIRVRVPDRDSKLVVRLRTLRGPHHTQHRQ